MQADKREVRTKILFVAAEPKGVDTIRLGAEFRKIIEQVKYRDPQRKLKFHSLWATQLEDLMDAVFDEKPSVIHFSSHGTPEGGLVLEDVDGSPKVVDAQGIESLFRTYGKSCRVVLVNSCYSAAIAEKIVDYVDIVIGMSDGIGVDSAINFSSGFYRGLAAGESVERCFEMGKAEIAIQKAGSADIPVLYTRSGVRSHEISVLSHSFDDLDQKEASSGSGLLDEQLLPSGISVSGGSLAAEQIAIGPNAKNQKVDR